MKRKLLVLTLTLLLVVSMAVPAFAGSYSGDYGGIGYTCTLNVTVSRSTSQLTSTLPPLSLKTEVKNWITINADYTSKFGQTSSASGVSPISAVANNYAWSDVYNAYLTGEVKYGYAKYYLASDLVKTMTVYP